MAYDFYPRNQPFLDSDQESVLVEHVTGFRTKLNFFFAFIVFFGSVAELVVGIYGYRGQNLIVSCWSKQIIFYPKVFPRGIAGILIQGILNLARFFNISSSAYLWYLYFLNVGGGYDLFDKKRGLMYRFRWIVPRNNENSTYEDYIFLAKDIESIHMVLYWDADSTHVLMLKRKSYQKFRYQTFYTFCDMKEGKEKGRRMATFLRVPFKIDWYKPN
uniref:Photosystem I assembly protein Ycf4 n=1 Tax=Passiflora filipes TaxID=298520 RepID=A0A4Y5QFY7_9ROSI|nr:photosystem I assembly protein Ycf4 [Passiflora filipes]QCX30518.1 photosystem I assembly protein Ycf4 [Passiflora filipes]